MADPEKVTVNLSPVDVAKIDYLVDHGFYSSRSDFIRAGVRTLLARHSTVVSDDALTANMWGVGVIGLGPEELRELARQGRKTTVHVVGVLHVSKGVSRELLEETIDRVRVYGTIVGPAEAVEYLRARQGEQAGRA